MFRFLLRLADGTDLGEVSYPDSAIEPGDVIRVSGNRQMRVLAVLPAERIGEFVDGATVAGVLQVEPLHVRRLPR